MQPPLELGNVPLDDFETYKHQPALIESTSTWDQPGTLRGWKRLNGTHPLEKHVFPYYMSFTSFGPCLDRIVDYFFCWTMHHKDCNAQLVTKLFVALQVCFPWASMKRTHRISKSWAPWLRTWVNQKQNPLQVEARLWMLEVSTVVNPMR
jgi:hypothetical protein